MTEGGYVEVINIEVFDEHRRKYLKDQLEKGERPAIVAGFISFYVDDKLALCSDCRTPVYVRLWIYEAIVRYGLRVLCICCVDLQDFKGQLIMDLAKIEEGKRSDC